MNTLINKDEEIARLHRAIEVCVEALEFYAAPWGPHHGNDDYTNQIVMGTLNKARFKAKEALNHESVAKFAKEDNGHR
jgi:hypothetical protein